MPLSINLLDRTPASRVVVELGTDVREFFDCLVAMDSEGRAVHIWARQNRHPRPDLSVPLGSALIEWQRSDEPGREGDPA